MLFLIKSLTYQKKKIPFILCSVIFVGWTYDLEILEILCSHYMSLLRIKNIICVCLHTMLSFDFIFIGWTILYLRLLPA
jgi:hypothetical protein